MSWSNQSKSTSSWNIISYLLCENEDPLVQENNYFILIE